MRRSEFLYCSYTRNCRFTAVHAWLFFILNKPSPGYCGQYIDSITPAAST